MRQIYHYGRNVDPLLTRNKIVAKTINIEAGSFEPKETKFVSSTGKVMVSVFWDAKRILFIDYLQKGKIIMRI